jgi:hypothetical protein
MEIARMQPNAAYVFNVRGEKVTRLVACVDPERARADLGLTQDTGS